MHSLRTFMGIVILVLPCTAYPCGGDGPALTALAGEQFAQGRFPEAERLYKSALESPDALNNEERRAAILVALGDVYLSEERLAQAEATYFEALGYYRQKPDSPQTAMILRDLGAVYSLQGQQTEALRLLNQAWKITQSKSPPNAQVAAQILNSQGIVYFRQKKTRKALDQFQKALNLLGGNGPEVRRAEILGNLGAAFYAHGKFNRAMDVLRESLAISEQFRGPRHPDLTFGLSVIAVVYFAMGRYAEAEQAYRRCLEILEPDKAIFEVRIAHLLRGLAAVQARSGKKLEAETVMAEAAAIARRNLTNPEMPVVLEAYSQLLDDLGQGENARDVHREAERARIAAELVVRAHRTTQ